ncbi:hypothetical protein [Lentilactobacillus senioris]|uniref:Prophage protein n=1 Tax=Lentilactobacillus senioris DSM 24302 = JCM 17472 TaxID=1423802 RepID=A0A0R2CQJ0_9LACO|nr:hypothetical protein [Lentilactobacillus senioris]KRM93589.1 hypothetical protein FC56_GL000304 [Lentilactobacillus senioris DSM 24302 = JCM 17472]
MNYLFYKIKQNPFHVTIGLTMLLTGIFLITHDRYFKWPPMAVGFFNDDIIGGLFSLVGTAMIVWALWKRQSTTIDHIILIVASMLMMLLTAYQFLHWVILGLDMPWISNLGLTLIINILAYRSDAS